MSFLLWVLVCFYFTIFNSFRLSCEIQSDHGDSCHSHQHKEDQEGHLHTGEPPFPHLKTDQQKHIINANATFITDD